MADEITEVLQKRDYTKLLFGSYAENPSWVEFMNCITEVFADRYTKQLTQLANVRVPENSSREVNIMTAKNLGFDLKNKFFSNEEYITLIENLQLYARKKGTKHFMSILGLIKNAHFNVYQLWTKDYEYFERESTAIIDNSILKDYKRITDSSAKVVSYGYITSKATQKLSFGLVTDKAKYVLAYGEITPLNISKESEDINDPSFYVGKYYPTSHVDLDYDIEKYPIDEADIRYLFYKIAPANLVLHTIDGVMYLDEGIIYMTPIPFIEQSYDTYIGFAMYEGTLYTFLTDFEWSAFYGNPVLNYKKDENAPLETLNWFDKTYNSLPASLYSGRDSRAWYVNESREIVAVPERVARFIDEKGILFEPESKNFVRFSNKAELKRTTVNRGTYTFSCTGKQGSKVQLYGPFPDIYVYAGESFTFTVSTESATLTINPDVAIRNVQVEQHKFATTPIVNNSEILITRKSDCMLSSDALDKSTMYFRFNCLDNTEKHWLFSYGRASNDTLDVFYEDGKVKVETVYRGVRTLEYEKVWDISNDIGFILNTDIEGGRDFILNVNVNPDEDPDGENVTLQLNGKPYMFRLGSDWNSENGLFGYLTHFVCIKNNVFE